MPPGNANVRTGAASGALVIVGEMVSACLGRRLFGSACVRFASRRVSAAGWGKPGIHEFKPNKSSLSPAPSFIVVIVIITRMAVAVIITIILLFIMSSLPPSSA